MAGEEYEFNATLTKTSRAAKRMRWVWAAEAPGSNKGYRILGAGQFGKFRIPADITDRYPMTFQVRLIGVDGLRRLYESIGTYKLLRMKE